MSTTKSAGSSRLGRDSQPKYLGIKVSDGQKINPGMIIVRQRGLKFIAGENTKKGSDDTIYSLKKGVVKFKNKTLIHFDRSKKSAKIVSVE